MLIAREAGSVSDKRIVVQRGLWFEEFETGVLYQHRPGRTITEADKRAVHHADDEYPGTASRRRPFSDALPPFNQRLVNSMFTLSDDGRVVGGAANAGARSLATSASVRSLFPKAAFSTADNPVRRD